MATSSSPISSSNTLDQLCRDSVEIRKRELPHFQSLFDQIVQELTDPRQQSNADSDVDHSLLAEGPGAQIDLAHRWLRDMMQYNVPHGKLIRGLSVTINYQILKYGYECIKAGGSGGAADLTTKCNEVTQARIVGWCVEMFQAYFLMLDDIMDNSITRRGQPCWYRNVSLYRSRFL